jgi:hypothetical protein
MLVVRSGVQSIEPERLQLDELASRPADHTARQGVPRGRDVAARWLRGRVELVGVAAGVAVEASFHLDSGMAETGEFDLSVAADDTFVIRPTGP